MSDVHCSMQKERKGLGINMLNSNQLQPAGVFLPAVSAASCSLWLALHRCVHTALASAFASGSLLRPCGELLYSVCG